ncbi:MAG: hypothetical protein GXP31_08720 [Kiritimatiellaeota bacterium]|nr:hypothetical protein [Kiritimatiellota bacterium]
MNKSFTMTERVRVGCYYFPNYHVDPRNEAVHGPGWSEWELVRRAEPRFPGHTQPCVPAWGHEDEADPRVMSRKIDAAADHDIDFWIFDWYWYDDGPFLERGLEQGFLNAPNNDRLRFCCMWANHDWLNIHPARRTDVRQVLYPGQVGDAAFETLTQHVIDRYFRHPSHLLIDGRPYFSIYELTRLLAGFGSVSATRTALDRFRDRTRAAGFPDLHLNAVVWGRPVLPGEEKPADAARLVADLGFDSVTSYVWIHHVPLNDSPFTAYEQVRDAYFQYWDDARVRFGVPYFPNVTVGWDSSPRTVQSDRWAPVGYPFTNMIGGSTPAAFETALRLARDRLEDSGDKRILTVNAWNEWTEGSYLEPDAEYGMARLEALRAVFGAPSR